MDYPARVAALGARAAKEAVRTHALRVAAVGGVGAPARQVRVHSADLKCGIRDAIGVDLKSEP